MDNFKKLKTGMALLFLCVIVNLGYFSLSESQAFQKAPIKKLIERSDAPMVLVPGGKFFMGSDNKRIDEKPRRKVFLDSFYIEKYPVKSICHYLFYYRGRWINLSKHYICPAKNI